MEAEDGAAGANGFPRLAGPLRCLIFYKNRLTSIFDVLAKAPTGCTWSYRMMTPTMTRRQKDTVSSFVNRLLYSLREGKYTYINDV